MALEGAIPCTAVGHSEDLRQDNLHYQIEDCQHRKCWIGVNTIMALPHKICTCGAPVRSVLRIRNQIQDSYIWKLGQRTWIPILPPVIPLATPVHAQLPPPVVPQLAPELFLEDVEMEEGLIETQEQRPKVAAKKRPQVCTEPWGGRDGYHIVKCPPPLAVPHTTVWLMMIENPAATVAAKIQATNALTCAFASNRSKTDKLNENDLSKIKPTIYQMWLQPLPELEKPLKNLIKEIGLEDFPRKWNTLINELVDTFGSGNMIAINRGLKLLHILSKKFRMGMCTKLWEEIKIELKDLSDSLIELFGRLMDFSVEQEGNQDALKVIYSSLLTAAKIFNSLNYQDLPEYFEDNMQAWMANFDFLLNVYNPLLNTANDEEPGLLDQLKTQICDNVGMYAHKCDEEFENYVPRFLIVIWELILTTGSQRKYDLLVSKAIEFLAIVVVKAKHKHIFESPSTMSSICEKVIIPNMEFRQSDEELFDNNPQEYMERDLEGSDIDTRRRAACDLVRALSKHFEQQITTIFGEYVQVMLTRYAEDKTKNWRNKDAAIYLVTSLSTTGISLKFGDTKITPVTNSIEFYNTNILPDLVDPNLDDFPVLKADAIKYVMTFRNLLPQYTMKEALAHLARLLLANSTVVHTYAVVCIDKILLLRDTDNGALVKSWKIPACGTAILSNLFSVFDKPGSKENEYVMKAIMRTFSALQEGIIPFMAAILPKLTSTLISVVKNPSKPHFNHYLFESLSLSIRIMCQNSPQSVSQFEATLFPIFVGILQNDVIEFIPYTFQVFALLLQVHTGTIPQPYMEMLPGLLAPILWERPANVTPLVKFLITYIKLSPQQIVSSNNLTTMLGVFQKLIASKTNDKEGFNLVAAMIEYLPEQAMSQYMKQIFTLFFQRLQSSKTVKFIKGLLVFFGSYIIKFGAVNLIQMIDGMQVKMFSMVLDRIWISETQKLTGVTEKKIAAVGIIKVLCEAPEMINGQYSNYWPQLLHTLIGLFELPEDASTPVDEHFVELDPEEGNYQYAYVQLVFVGRNDVDPLKDTVPDVKIYLAQSLGKLSVANPGKLMPVINSSISPEAQTYLAKYLQLANVQLV